MKNIFILAVLAITLSSPVAAQNNVKPAIPADPEIERNVENLLSKMTLDEKIGQMTQLCLDVLGKGDNVFHSIIPFQFDEAILDTVINQFKVGSILSIPGSTPLTRTEWTEIITRLQEESIKATGIPLLYGVDEIHGTTYTLDGTLFPHNINIGASFNVNIARESARISAYETKASNIPWTFAPVLDLGREPRWPRIWETFGEDTYLVTQMGEQMIHGFQGADPNHIGKESVSSCLKHFLGYGVPFTGRDRTPSYISEQDMREKHFAPFLKTIQAGALSVMVNSAMNNGMPLHADYKYLTQWLKNDLNWDGVIVTDWADIHNLFARDHIAKDKKEAIKLAINAGIDMAMDPYSWDFCIYLKELVQEGQVSMERIDDATKRVLRMKYRLGLFEKPYWNINDYPEFGSAKHAETARKSAEESITLLQNTDQFLPIAKNKKILVTGPNANSMRCLNGGWSYSWQGDRADEFAGKYNTILEAFINKTGKNNVVYEPGVTYKQGGAYWEENAPEIEKAVAAARNVDVIVACIGENSYCETPGNLSDLTLSRNQIDLVKTLAATGKPVILVLNEGRPRIINEIVPLVQSIVHIYLPGNYGGDALANVIYGDVNPSGKLPYTYPQYVHTLNTYDYKPSENIGRMDGLYFYDAAVYMQWPFGYGLSYTDFAYNDLTTDKTSFRSGDIIKFTINVKNTGNRTGKESVLLYSSDEVASLTPDIRRLRAFQKVELNPGAMQTLTFELKADDLAFVGQDGKWRLEEGDFIIQVGYEKVKISCTQTKVWDTPNK